MKIEDFIAQERRYFLDILSKQKQTTALDLAQWRNETVAERKQRLSTEIFALCDQTVAYGPFKGLRITDQTWWGAQDLGAIVLGFYEMEILNIIDGFGQDAFETFIDVGAADGYYGCGMLTSGKASRSICFEMSEDGQAVIQKNWELNGCPGTLEIYGKGSSDAFQSLTDINFSKSLMLIDIEGAEFELIDRMFLQRAKGANIIIEVHHWVDGFLEKYEELLKIMDKDFHVTVVEPVDRPINSLQLLKSFTDENRALVAAERRPCLMRFIWLQPK
jgi:precorrin-6B methylase 2